MAARMDVSIDAGTSGVGSSRQTASVRFSDSQASRHAEALRGKPTAFLSVSLGVLQQDPEVQREVEAIVNGFLETTGWKPAMVQNVAGAVL